MATKKTPNVIIVYADDLGYGDLSCYGAEEIKTPNIDKLLEDGIKFENGYSASAVCTPARYSLLTGEYPFRNPKTYILPGDAACIIPKDKNTLPKIFKAGGYTTGIIGKWHLGIGNGNLNWNAELTHTPNDIGFDYSFIFPATADRVPCVYVENNKVVNLDVDDPIKVSYAHECPYDGIVTSERNPEMLRMMHSCGHNQSIVNGVGRIGYMSGGEKAIWKDEDLAETFLDKATSFIDKSGDKPFFLFYAMHQPHVPRLPNQRFKGATKLGPRGDVIVEMDWCVGQLMEHLERSNLLDNTIIFFSSDNGPVVDDGYKDDAATLLGAHLPAGPLRGGKYSKFDGGARVPTIVSWKSHIKKQTSQALVGQVDLMSSFASMLDVKLETGDCVDSENVLSAILGDSQVGRDELMYEDVGKGVALRRGKWSYLSPSAGAKMDMSTNTELGNSLDPQLFNMDYDIGQRKNVAERYPELSASMQKRLDEITKCAYWNDNRGNRQLGI